MCLSALPHTPGPTPQARVEVINDFLANLGLRKNDETFIERLQREVCTLTSLSG